MKLNAYEENDVDWTQADEDILNDLMRLYGQDVLYLAYTYLRDKQAAEDVVQDVFIQCYRHLNQFRHESSVKTWLFRITVNRCKDLLKSWSYRNIVFNPFRVHSLKTTDPSVENQLVKKSESEALSKCVLSLPIKYREVIILFYFEELSLNDICTLLKLNVNSVKSRLHRARKMLGKMLMERSGEGGSQLEKS